MGSQYSIQQRILYSNHNSEVHYSPKRNVDAAKAFQEGLYKKGFPRKAFQERLFAADSLTFGKQLGNNATHSHSRCVQRNTLDNKARIGKRKEKISASKMPDP